MPKIIWVGNKPWGTEFPEFPMPKSARLIERPENIFTACLPYGIIPLLFSYALIGIKWHIIGTRAINPVFMPAGIILGLLMIPFHEILHAAFFAAPSNAILSGICIPSGIIGMLSPMPDYMDVHLVCSQVPKRATIQMSNNGFFWYTAY